MVEHAAGLDYIKDKVANRTDEIIFHAECEKSVQICVKSHVLLVQQELKVGGRLPVLFCFIQGFFLLEKLLYCSLAKNSAKATVVLEKLQQKF